MEFLVGTPLNTAYDTDVAATSMSMTAKPDLKVDFDRLCFQAYSNTASIYPTLDVGKYGIAESMLYRTSTQLIVGKNTPEVPLGIWSPYREVVRQFPLGWLDLPETSDMTWTVSVAGSTIVGDALFCAPCTVVGNPCGSLPEAPVRQAIARGQFGTLKQAGSPQVQIAAAGGDTLTITFDDDGIVDLGTLRMNGISDAAAATEGAWINALPATIITSITDPSNQPLLFGANTPVAGASLFDPGTHRWVDFGLRKVSSGSTFSMVIKNGGPDVSNYSLAANFWSMSGITPDGKKACAPSPSHNFK
jgi:hypothetical protein|tara:strand:+ start:2297 stop:3208 length:912 start_codon:yes stop_codon:yes gene_type:complete